MTDAEATKLCAQAMGIETPDADPVAMAFTQGKVRTAAGWTRYDPLHDDAQAMALAKKFGLLMEFTPPNEYGWWVQDKRGSEKYAFDLDLNRAIVYCVAVMSLDAAPRLQGEAK